MAISEDSEDTKVEISEGNSSDVSNEKQETQIESNNLKRSSSSPLKSPPLKKKLKALAVITGDKDIFCWQCHKNGSITISCQICPRIYHRRCAKLDTVPSTPWTCIECTSKMMAESLHTRSEAMKSLTQDQINRLLKFVMDRIQTHDGSKHFANPVDLEEYPNYKDYIINPMDLTKIEKSISDGKYQSTETFLADLKWLVHNSYIFNSVYSHLTSYARGILKIAKQETDEIENCPNCYYHAHTLDEETWFIEPCKKPHLLIWAKLRGFPHWPGKIMKVVDDLVDVRFFGDHNRAWIPSEYCYLFSKNTPGCSNKRNIAGLNQCLKEVSEHVIKLREKYGVFKYAAPKTKYTPSLHDELLAEMLPSLKGTLQNKTDIKANGLGKRISCSEEDPEVLAQKKKKVEDCLEKLHLSKAEETLDDVKEKNENPDDEKSLSEQPTPDSTSEADKAKSPEKLVAEPEVILIPDDPPEDEKQAKEEGGLRLKVKSSEQLLSSAALKLQKSAGQNEEVEFGEKSHLDKIIDKVSKGDITVTIPTRERKITEKESRSDSLNGGKDVEIVKEVKGRSASSPLKGSQKITAKATQKPFDIRELSEHITVDNISDISTWSLEPYNDASSTNDAMDEILSCADNIKDLDEAKNMFMEIKKLVSLQRQEMKEFYAKMRQEAQEVCDVFLIEQEKLNEIKQDLSKSIKKVKKTKWCATCFKEAKFYCCWGTSYCSTVCQKKDWANHYESCSQADQRSKSSGNQSSLHESTSSVKPVHQPLKITGNVLGVCDASVANNSLSITLPPGSSAQATSPGSLGVVSAQIMTSASLQPAGGKITKSFILPKIQPKPVLKFLTEQKSMSMDGNGRIILSKTPVASGTSEGGVTSPCLSGGQTVNWSTNLLTKANGPTKIGHKYYVFHRNHTSPVQLSNIAKPLKVLPMQ